MINHKRGREELPIQYDLFGEIYAPDAKKVGKYGFPQLEKVEIVPEGEVKSFNYLKSTNNLDKYWVHCFVDDYQFERLWKNMNCYKSLIEKTKGFITTDFSLYRDYSEDYLIWNCYRNRVMAYATQKYKKNVIPTAGFGNEKTWKWCFDGLPYESTVAITTNGIWNDAEARRLFVGGIEAMVQTINPTIIVVCGKCPEWLMMKYPKIKICNIPSYSQQWKMRGAV